MGKSSEIKASLMAESMRRKKGREEVKRDDISILGLPPDAVSGVTEESDSDSFEGRKGFKASRKPWIALTRHLVVRIFSLRSSDHILVLSLCIVVRPDLDQQSIRGVLWPGTPIYCGTPPFYNIIQRSERVFRDTSPYSEAKREMRLKPREVKTKAWMSVRLEWESNEKNSRSRIKNCRKHNVHYFIGICITYCVGGSAASLQGFFVSRTSWPWQGSVTVRRTGRGFFRLRAVIG